MREVTASHPGVQLRHVVDGRDHDLRREGERGQHDPGRERSVVGSVGRSAGDVVQELAFDPSHRPRSPARAVRGRDSPAPFSVANEAVRIADRIVPMDVRRLTAVLEIVRAALPHEGVANAPEIYPEVGELVREQRAGVEDVPPVDIPPSVGRRVCSIALLRQREARRAEAEDVDEQGLVVAPPAVRDEAILGAPAMGERRPTVQGPAPVGSPVELVGQPSYLCLLPAVTVEVGRTGEHARAEEGRVDGRQLTVPHAPTGLHVEEMIVEAL
jgi:hypothetical protein